MTLGLYWSSLFLMAGRDYFLYRGELYMGKEIQKQTAGPLTYHNRPQEFLLKMCAFLDTMQKVYRSKMADAELMIWKETLKDYSYQEFERAMTELVSNPPRYELDDGSVQVWRGMPKLPDVVGVMQENRDKDYLKRQRMEAAKRAEEMQALEKRRAEHPEEFLTWEEIAELAQQIAAEKGQKSILKAMPSTEDVSPVLLGLDGGKREKELAEQAKLLMKKHGENK